MPHLRSISVYLILMLAATSTVAGAQTVSVVSYNVAHAGRTGEATLAQIASAIRAQPGPPTIVAVQELDASKVSTFVNELNAAYNVSGTTGWKATHQTHCDVASGTTCTSTGSGEGVAVLTLHTLGTAEKRYFMYPDDYWAGRGAVRVPITLPGDTIVNVWSVHIQHSAGAVNERRKAICDLKQWASTITGPRLIGGDFNAAPGTTEISGTTACTNQPGFSMGMAQGYEDAWVEAQAPANSSRIDYWFSNQGSPNANVGTVGFDTSVPYSDHDPLRATYTLGTGTQPAAYSDSFSDGVLNGWTRTVFSGSTQDPTIGANETSGQLQIGPLKQNLSGTHYDGVTTAVQYDITGGYAYVQLVRPGAGAQTDSMFTLGTDTSHYYRLYVKGSTLYVQKNVGGKVALGNIPYSATSALYLRIRHISGAGAGTVEFATATAPGGTWTPIIPAAAWDSAIPRTVWIELKAGTSASEMDPGLAIFDNFQVFGIPR